MTESEASTLTTTFGEPGKADREVTAISAIVAALKPLKEDEVRNVLEYVLRRFAAGPLAVYPPSQAPPSAPQTASSAHSATGAIKDVRSLREEKEPKSANQMAALVSAPACSKASSRRIAANLSPRMKWKPALSGCFSPDAHSLDPPLRLMHRRTHLVNE